MHGGLDSPRRVDDALGLLHFLCRAVCHQQELVGLERGFIANDAVLGNTDADEPRTNRRLANPFRKGGVYPLRGNCSSPRLEASGS